MAESPVEARLFVLAGPDLARSFPLGERTTLGRAEGCEVVLHDRSISRKHAAIVRQGSRWFVQDLGSTNGISKDGERAERLELADGDEFKLGDLPLRFKLTSASAEAEIEFEFAAPSEARAIEAPRSAPAPRAAAGPVEDEIRLEGAEEEDALGEIELEEPGSPPSGASAPLATAFRPARVERRTGLLEGDLEQRPFWLRVVLFLTLLALAGGLAYAAYRAVQMVRAGL